MEGNRLTKSAKFPQFKAVKYATKNLLPEPEISMDTASTKAT